MKSTFCNRYFPKFRNFARQFIASVSLLSFCSVFAQDANTASIASDVESILQSLNWALRNPISSDSGYIPERLDDLLEYDTATYKFLTGRTSTTASINYNDKNALPYLLGSLVYGLTGWAPNSSQPLDHSLHGDLTTGNQTLVQLLALLHNISNVVAQSASTVVVSNFVSVTNSGGGVLSPDILAGNPWWSTNSGFAFTKSYYTSAFPEIDSPAYMFTFPEFASVWSSKLTEPNNNLWQSVGWQNLWGKDSISRWWSESGRTHYKPTYTWFDWMTDAMRSNWVSLASLDRSNSAMLRAMLGTSNEVWNSANYVANHLDSGFEDVTNLLSLLVNLPQGENPWWWTNSNFAVDWTAWRDDVPLPPGDPRIGGVAFPYIFSFLASQLNDSQYSENFFDEWGLGGQNEFGTPDSLSHLTWFDWVSEIMKSNLVLTTSSSYSNLVAEVSQYDTSDDTNPTNVPLPEYSLPDSETVPGASDTLSSAESGLLEKIETIQPNYTGGDDEIVVIPSFSIGGINVREYRARLGTSITPFCRRVASFIWYVGLFAFLFAFAKTEFVYYATLGKFWVRKG